MKPTDIQAKILLIDDCWNGLLVRTALLEDMGCQVEIACNGQPAALLPAVHTMFRLRDRMLLLLANPMPDHPGRNAGPTFEWDLPDE